MTVSRSDHATLDLPSVRAHFPVFATDAGAVAHLENAGGSFACAQTVDALTTFYVHDKVQPGYPAAPSTAAAARMDHARARWAEALGVAVDEVHLGPSTTANTYVLAHAIGATLGPGDEVVVTDQDHEANRGATERAVAAAGATLRVWEVDRDTGRLDLDRLAGLVGPRTRWVHVPLVSNVIGVENDVAAVATAAHAVGARVVVDAVAAAPHGLPDPVALDADVVLFSLYKVFSVHQGLMTVRREVLDALPNQSHFFNDEVVHKRLNPAGPDHAQVAASGAVLDYLEASAADHGVTERGLRATAAALGARWRDHEDALAGRMVDWAAARDDVRLLGGADHATPWGPGHRCPTVAVDPRRVEPAIVAAGLAARHVGVGVGHFYAWRTLAAMGIDPDRGVVRASAAHYTTHDEVDRLLDALDEVLDGAGR